MDVILPLLSNVLIPGTLFALVAAGFSLIYAVTRVIHVAHGGVTVAAGYVFWFCWSALDLPALLAAAVAVAAAVALGVGMNVAVYERLRGRRAVSAAGILIATLSLLLIVQNALTALFGAGTVPLAALQGRTRDVLGVILTTHELRILAIGPAALAALALWLSRSRTGTALRAVADHETVAEVVGIDSRRMRTMAFALGSALAGLAGVLLSIEYNLEPGMGVSVALRMFFRAVLGGIGSIGGAVVGSLVTETGVALTAWYVNSAWTDLASFLLTFAVLTVRPQGLFGARRRSI